MLAAQLNAYGDPLECVEIVDVQEPGKPGAGEALIAIEYSPINPADILFVRGYYALRPSLPSFIGNEGVGTVLHVGSSVSNVKQGDRVVVPLSRFAWRERLLIPAKELAPLPANADPKQLAMLAVNPVTAQLLLNEFVPLQAGAWVVQNAANSGVGRSVIAIAKDRGLRTLNIVRRPDIAQELQAAGADITVIDGPDLIEKIKTITHGEAIRLGLDAIGGQATATLASVIAPGGLVVCYGAMSATPPAVNPADLIFKELKIGGFFLGAPAHAPKFPALIAEGARLIASGTLNVPIAAIYPLAEIKQAIAHAQAGGKILLRISRE